MKNILFEGRRLDVPDWANYVVQEKDGSIRALECEPVLLRHFVSWSVLYGRNEDLIKGELGKNVEPVCKNLS